MKFDPSVPISVVLALILLFAHGCELILALG